MKEMPAPPRANGFNPGRFSAGRGFLCPTARAAALARSFSHCPAGRSVVRSADRGSPSAPLKIHLALGATLQ